MLAALAEITEPLSLDVLGEWWQQTGGTPDAPIYSQVPGWHFNVRSLEPITWPATVTVTSPATPWRVWG